MIKRLLKNNILLSISSLISLVINIVTIPVITRVYSPADIGLFASLQILATVLFPIFGMRMEIIFAQNIKISELKILFSTTAIIGIFLAIFSSIILFLTANYVNQPFLIDYLMWILFLAIFLVYFEFGIGILNRLQLYKLIAIFSVLNIASQRILQIIFGIFISDKTLAIFLSYCIPSLIIAIIMFLIFNKKINLLNNLEFSFKTIQKYSRHIFYRISYSLSNLFKNKFIVILIITFFSAQYAGLYNQALGLLLIPVAVFSNPLKTIITREYSQNKNDTVKMIIIIYNILIFILLPIYIFLFFQSFFLFPLLFGSDWSDLSSVFNILLIPMFILIFSTSLDRLYDVLQMQKYAFLFELLFGLLSFAAFFVLSLNGYNFLEALKINALILGVFFSTFILFIFNKANILHHFIKTLAYFIIQVFFCLFLFFFFKNSLVYSFFFLGFILLFGLIFVKNDLQKILN